jgi:hypothetical protein
MQVTKNKRNMKKNIIFAFTVVVFLTGCIKNDPVILQDRFAEFDATAVNANAAGLNYPIIGRIPGFGRVANTTDSTLRRLSQTVRLRINLVGSQSSSAETVTYQIFPLPASVSAFSMPATITGQTPAAAAATLSVSDAVAGTHFTVLSGTMTIPANSSFGFLDVPVLAATPTAGAARFLGIKLINGGSIKPSVNYSEVGLIIDQR